MRIKYFMMFLAMLLFQTQLMQIKPVCIKLADIFSRIEKGTIEKKLASRKLDSLFSQIPGNFFSKRDSILVFPLRHYSINAIGGIKGNGYIFKGYQFLDGNKHLVHPADDIFIQDRNQDNLDDRTQKPVDVLSVLDGIVIAEQKDWEKSSDLRGGKYIWIYHPQFHLISYYAHNQKLMVEIGDQVKKGDKIAEVGRTGFNAYKKRSPTHLHFSLFKLEKGIPVPINPYPYLIKSIKR